MDQQKIRIVQQKVLQWFEKHERDLPWRKTRDPYRILVAEVMLQQTQVDRVVSKYTMFLQRFPSFQSLAAGSAADVIRVWSGLGYNRRAVMLHRCAQAVVRNYDGKMPDDIGDLEKLPGIGPYTARAIATFAFGQDVAVLDTNHRRVIHRIFLGLELPKPIKSDKELLNMAAEILPKGKGYLWNHALMDFGALVCTSRSPQCQRCPLRAICAAYPDIQRAGANTQKLLRGGRKGREQFEGSNRFYRGRIMEILRRDAPISFGSMEQKMVTYRLRDKTRLHSLLSGLAREQLVVYDRRLKEINLPGSEK